MLDGSAWSNPLAGTAGGPHPERMSDNGHGLATGAHPNHQLVQDGFAAIMTDLDALRAFLADDVVVHSTGDHQFSGDFEGADEVTSLIRRMFEATSNTMRFEPFEVFADDELVLIKAVMHAERNGRVIDLTQIDLVHLNESGQVSEAWVFPEDTEATDNFWS